MWIAAGDRVRRDGEAQDKRQTREPSIEGVLGSSSNCRICGITVGWNPSMKVAVGVGEVSLQGVYDSLSSTLWLSGRYPEM